MATVTVKLFQAGADLQNGEKADVAILDGCIGEQFTSSASSQATTATAPDGGRRGETAFARIHSSGGAIRITSATSPTAVGTNSSHPVVADGETFDCSIKPGEKIALIDFVS